MSDGGSSGGSSSGSESSASEDNTANEQHVHQVVTGANADPQVLQYFWDLASLEQAERQAAAEALVAALVDSQKQYDATHRAKGDNPGGTLEQLEAGGNRQQRMEECLSCCSPLMAYGLKRLARGLASSRQGARQGFAAALAATLAHSAAAATNSSSSAAGKQLQRPFVSAAGVLALLDACLEVTGSMKGTDQRDALLGRVFGLAALTRSGLITAVPAAAAADDGSSSSAVAAVAAVAEQLSGLMQRKSFLRESAAAGLVELLQGLGQQQLSAVLTQAPRTASLLHATPAQATPESLYLVLRLWHALPAQQLEQCALLPKLSHGASPPPQAFWEAPSSVKRKSVGGAAAAVFAADHVQLMAPALLLSTASSPRLHPVWGCLLALLVPGFVPVKGQADDKKQQKRSPPDPQQLQALWQTFVEGSCLSSSHERKALALQLLQLLLPVMGPDMVPVLLSKQVLSCVATALKDKESYLHASAKRCLDRLSTAADHNEVVKGDAVAAARLRLALAAALQSANLAAPSGTKAAKAAKLGPLQGLDAAGVAAYVEQMLQELVKAAQAGGSAANGAVGGSSDDEGEGEEDDAADDSKVLQQLEQLVAGLKLPAAETATLRKGLSFLAALAWLQLPAGFDAAAAAAGGGSSSKKAGKKHKHKQDAGGVLQHSEVQEGLQLAASISQPSDALRHTAAARLVGLLHHVHSRAGALAAAAAHQQGKQQSNKKQQQKAGQDGSEAAAARAAAANAADAITVELLELYGAAQKLASVAVTADEDIAEMVEQLGQLSAAVDQHAPTTLPPTCAAASAAASNTNQQQHQQHQQQQQAARKRVVLHLVHQLQLQLLSGGLSAEAAGSVVDDLEVSVLKGLGLSGQLLDQLRAADAAARLKMAGVAVEDDDAAGGRSSSKQQNGAAAKGRGSSSSSEDDDEDDAQDSGDESDDDDGSAWQDVLLDLLLSLLSNSSSGSGSGGVSVPSVPLREACEAVFKAFAEEMSAQGIADLLRVLSQRASEVLKPTDEDEEEEDDEEEEVEQGSGSESGDDASSSDLDDEQQEQLKDLHKKTAAGKSAASSSGRSSGSSSSSGSESSSDSEEEADKSPSAAATANGTASNAKKAGGSASDEDEGDESGGGSEGADDEAMLRMDKALGAAVRASLNRSGGSAKDRAAALLALQLRVAALLEDWLKKCSRSPIVLSVVLPLLKALVAARGAGGNPVLADRLAGLITKHLARARPAFPATSAGAAAAAAAGGGKDVAAAAAAAAAAASDDGEEEDSDGEAATGAGAGAGVGDWVRSPVSALEADARKVLYYASRDKDPRVAAAASQSLLVLINAGSEAAAAAGASGVAQATAAAALQDYLQHKKSRLQHSWCQQGLLARCFDAVVGGEGAALQVLLTACSKGRNEAMRCKAVQLLPSLVTGRQQAQVESLLGVLKQQQGLLAAALGAGVVGPFKNKDQHAACVKAVVVLLSGVLKQGGGKRLAELVGSEAVRELGKSVVVVKAAGVPPKVEGQLDRLVAAAGLQQLVAAGKPDPARLALLTKARAALESGGAQGGGGKDTVQGKDARGQQQQSQKQKGGGKQQQQQEKQQKKKKRKADGDAAEDKEQQPAKQKKPKAGQGADAAADKKKKRAAGGAGAGASKKKQKK